MQKTSRWRCCLLAIPLLAACGSDDEMDAASVIDGDVDDPASVCSPEIPPFATGASGLTQMDEAANLQVRIAEADWEPPAKDYNTWEIAVTDLAGAPLSDAVISWACSWMPAHGHGINPKAIEKLPDGHFSLVKMNLSMNGGWDVRLWIDPTGAAAPFAGGTETRNSSACTPPDGNAKQQIEFKVCVPRDRGDN